MYERYAQVVACKYVDEVLVYSTEEDLLNLIKTQHIDIRFLGDEYKTKDFTGKQWCLDNGVELHYHLRGHPYSSSGLRYKTYLAEQERIDGVHKSQLDASVKFDNNQSDTGTIAKEVDSPK
jgi:glycerol-3-phosphate cytidylyltransferase